MLRRSTILREKHKESSMPLTPSSSPNPSSAKQKTPSNRRPKSNGSKENAPPPDLNQVVMLSDYSPSPSSSDLRKPMKSKSPLPPRPPLKRKLSVESVGSEKVVSSDSGVKVIVRVRPLNKDEEEEEMIVQKISDDSLSIAGHNFTFDSIADCCSSQMHIFELVGVPLVENCIAGFNSSVFAYGQTGSGKTYTIWGPANSLMDGTLSNNQQGLTPRVFQRLFARIEEEQAKHADKQLVYQCRCSFLEIYNEQITDLLDPTQKNLQIREDVKTGLYVDHLSEAYVSSMKDVMQLLVKGMSNRRTGSTSANAESSRSHSVFTCVVESRRKSTSDGLSCFKTSRINLVDLAGSERQKLTGAAGERLKEASNINRSLSQLGNLINILAEVSQTGKQRHIPYRDSKLTFLLQESLGGNAKLAMICGISPAERFKNETLSTLRFAQRAKAVKNKAIVNEEMQDDVKVLKEMIRQLKDELVQMKANANQTDQDGNNFRMWNARRSLNLLKFSLNRPLTLARVEDDSDVEMEIVDQDERFELQSADTKERCAMDGDQPREVLCAGDPSCEDDADVNMEEAFEQMDKQGVNSNYEKVDNLESVCSCSNRVNFHVDESNGKEKVIHLSTKEDELLCLPNVEKPQGQIETSPLEQFAFEGNTESSIPYTSPARLVDNAASADLTTVAVDVSPVPKSPAPSVSPRVSSNNRKCLRTSSVSTASHKGTVEKNSGSEVPSLPLAKPSKSVCLNLSSQRSKSCFKSTEHLAASLQRGIEILDSHRQSVSFRKSSFRFSYKTVDTSKALVPVPKVDIGVQTLLPDDELVEADRAVFLCDKCKSIESKADLGDEIHGSNLQIVPIDGLRSCDKLKNHVPKSVEKVLAGAIRREMALEELCAKQNSEIMHLNRMVQQYKHERECNAIISQMREDKIFRLESLMDGVLTAEDFMEDELSSLIHEHKLLKEKYENHPEVLRAKIELKRVQDELDKYRNFVDLGERDVLLEEVQDLRNQLQLYIDSSPKVGRKKSPFLQLTHSCQPCLAPTLTTVAETNKEIAEERLKQERLQWTEVESKWITLVEELRSEIEAAQTLAEKHKHDLAMEKKCTEELSEAMRLAMEGHARMLEQYAELEERHMQMLARHRKVQDGIEDVKKAAARAGVRGAESKFINALAAEISALKVERERERQFFRDENRSLQAQLRDTAEAVEAAGELLVRLKEAEGAIAAAERRAIEAEREAERAYKEIDQLRRKQEEEVTGLNQLHAEPHVPISARPMYIDLEGAAPNEGGTQNFGDQQWREEFEPYYNNTDEELSKFGEPSSWFSGYDRCNI